VIFTYSIRVAPTLLGLYTGWIVAVYVIVAINGCQGILGLAKVGTDAIDPMMSYVYQALGSCIGGLVGYCYSAAFIMLVQTFISAYLIVRGSTMWHNFGFPNELVLMSSTTTQTSGLLRLPPAFYVYMLTILIMWWVFLRSHYRRKYRDIDADQKYIGEE
jgi:hypothetical protein